MDIERTVRLVLTALTVLALQVTPGWASIVGVAGDGNILVPNISGNTGATANFFDDTGAGILVHGWNERQNVVLASGITVDIVALGTYSAPFTSADATIPAGTIVSSHLLYFDPLNNAGRTATYEFDQDILGIIVLSDLAGDDRFLATDFLGNPLTLYPATHFNNRGIEFGPESVIFSGPRTLSVDLAASSPGDQIRVITAAAAVPEPTSVLLVGGGLAALAALRKRERPAP